MHKLDERFDCFCVKVANGFFSSVIAMHESTELKALDVFRNRALMNLQHFTHMADVFWSFKK